MLHVNHTSIGQFLEEFTADTHHRIGSPESESYAKYIVDKWKEYRIEKVEIDEIYEMVPTPSKVPSEVSVKDENGTVLYSVTLPELQVEHLSHVATVVNLHKSNSY